MTYLQRTTWSLVSGVKTALKEREITDMEADHVSALLIQILMFDGNNFLIDIKYLELALNAVRREKGRYIEYDEKLNSEE